MSNQDDLLQQKLEALKSGEALESVLSELEAGDEELEGLVRLASAIRTMSHPEPEGELSFEQAALLNPELVNKPDLAANRNGKVKHLHQDEGFLAQLNALLKNLLQQRANRWAIPVVAGALILMLAFVSSFGAGLWYAGPRQAQFAALQEVVGVVEVSRNSGETGWAALSNGDRVQAGDRLRTQTGSTANLVFFDGSRAELTPNTTLDITRLSGGYGKLLQVVLYQPEGKTVHEIIPFENQKAMYVVYTPGGTASVHGTKFSVEVDQLGRSRFAVNHGKVLVSNELSDIYLLSGQVTSSQAGQELSGADFQFSLQGELEEAQGNVWKVVGVLFEIIEETLITGEPEIGDLVLVEGRILEDGYWLADRVQLVEEGQPNGSFTGLLEDNEGQEWMVGGWLFMVDGETNLDEGLEIGSTVRVEFGVDLDGRWRAASIGLLSPPPVLPLPEPPSDPEARPSLSFEPDELEIQACAAAGPSYYEFGGFLTNTAGEAQDYASGVELSYQVIKGAEYVDGVVLSPSSWDRIDAGESVNFTIRLDVNPGWEAVNDGSEIKVRVFISGELNRPDHHRGRVTATLTSHCGVAPGDPPEAPPAPEPIVTPDPLDETDSICVGAEPQPTGMRLSQKYDVSYEEIMGWFCQRFGFGEIDLAYSLSREYNVPIADIFHMKNSGMGWGDIRKTLQQNFPNEPEDSELVTTPETSEEGDPTCVGAQPHPTGMRLAERYGVSYEEIMGWFCQRFGFGEIDLAYSIREETGMPVAEIFDLKSSGEGWGNIKKDLLPDKPGRPDNPGSPDKKDKPPKDK